MQINIDKLSGYRLLSLIVLPTLFIKFVFLGFSDTSGRTEIIMMFYLYYLNLLYFTWLWLLEINVRNRTKDVFLVGFYISLSVIYITMFVHVCALLIFSMDFVFPINGFEDITIKFNEYPILDDLYYLFNVAIIYVSFYLSRRIVISEKGSPSPFLANLKLFLFIYFLPVINIFFIQKRIKRIK